MILNPNFEVGTKIWGGSITIDYFIKSKKLGIIFFGDSIIVWFFEVYCLALKPIIIGI